MSGPPAMQARSRARVAFGLSPDGAWVFYSTALPSVPGKLMRAPISGGPPQLVSSTEATSGNGALRCARLPSTFCIYVTLETKLGIFYSFDLASETRRELARVPGGVNSDVFPDGSGIAVLIGAPPRTAFASSVPLVKPRQNLR